MIVICGGIGEIVEAVVVNDVAGNKCFRFCEKIHHLCLALYKQVALELR